MPGSTQKRLRVGICGAGIGGLVTALALSRHSDIQIDIYESAVNLAEIGAGIGLWPRQWKILKQLGLEKDLLQCTDIKPKEGPVQGFNYKKSDQPDGFHFYTLVTNGNLLMFHRADFQKVLLRHLPSSCRIHTSKRLHSYVQDFDGPVILRFDDGTTVSADVLLGADGLKSATRKSLLKEKAAWARGEGQWKDAEQMEAAIEPSWSGTVAYRSLIPADRLRAINPSHSVFRGPMQYLGRNGYVISYPIQHGKILNFVWFDIRNHLEGTVFPGPWVAPVDSIGSLKVLSSWEPEVRELASCAEKPLQWAVHTVHPLGSFISGRVAVMGDAAHGMTPHEGAGAGQAIEDAIILATVLGHPSTTRHTLRRALSIFDDIRRPFAMKVMQSSRLNGEYFTLQAHGFSPSQIENEFGRSGLVKSLEKLGSMFKSNWEWTWDTTIDDMVAEATRRVDGQN